MVRGQDKMGPYDKNKRVELSNVDNCSGKGRRESGRRTQLVIGLGRRIYDDCSKQLSVSSQKYWYKLTTRPRRDCRSQGQPNPRFLFVNNFNNNNAISEKRHAFWTKNVWIQSTASEKKRIVVLLKEQSNLDTHLARSSSAFIRLPHEESDLAAGTCRRWEWSSMSIEMSIAPFEQR
jgi:TFIIF-interacting CTD phosphatase-like protein